jgi:hypothetical protein
MRKLQKRMYSKYQNAKMSKPEIGSITHEVGIADVMLDDTATKNDHAGVDAEHGQSVDPSQVIQNVNYLHTKETFSLHVRQSSKYETTMTAGERASVVDPQIFLSHPYSRIHKSYLQCAAKLIF